MAPSTPVVRRERRGSASNTSQTASSNPTPVRSSQEHPSSSASQTSTQGHSLATVLEGLEYENPIANFLASQDSVNDRLVGLAESAILEHSSTTLSSIVHHKGSSINSASSMGFAQHQHGPASVVSVDASVPSLVSASSVPTQTDTSISTALAHIDGALSSLPLLEDAGEGLLERGMPTPRRNPVLECSFGFLSCDFITRNQEEWKVHCLSHFCGVEPPRKVQCPLCDTFSVECNDGTEAWTARLEHVARAHHAVGETLRTSRPDFDLFAYLWRQRLIDDAEYKELKGGTHILSGPRRAFTTTEGSRRQRPHSGPIGRRHFRQTRVS
jgi:hypothetical protein